MELKDALSLTADKVAVVGSDGKPLALTDKQKADLRNDLYYFYADAGKVTIRDLIDGTIAHYSESDKGVAPEVFAQMVYQLLQSAHALLADQAKQAQPAPAPKAPEVPEKAVAEPVDAVPEPSK